MRFQKYLPDPALRQYLVYYWTLEKKLGNAYLNYRFVPDGFVDWIIHLDHPWSFSFAKDDSKHSLLPTNKILVHASVNSGAAECDS